MMSNDNDPTLHRLRHLTVLGPDPARSHRVRMRCRAAIADRQPHGDPAIASRRLRALALESGLTYALSLGYLFGMIHDLLRLYMRR